MAEWTAEQLSNIARPRAVSGFSSTLVIVGPRAVATRSRTCGATSSMKVRSVSGSGGATRVNVPKPRSSARCVSTSAQWSGGPTIASSVSLAGAGAVGGELAGNVVDAPDLARVAAGLARGAVDNGLGLGGGSRRHVVHQRGGPAVGHAPGERQRARLRGAEPDLDRVRRLGPGPHALELVVAAVEAQRPLAAPARAQDRDGLLERLDASPGVSAGAPIACAASRNPPPPSPASKRPPLSRSSVAAAFANTAGGRSGRLPTSWKTRIRSVERGSRQAAPGRRDAGAGRDGPGRRAGRSRAGLRDAPSRAHPQDRRRPG